MASRCAWLGACANAAVANNAAASTGGPSFRARAQRVDHLNKSFCRRRTTAASIRNKICNMSFRKIGLHHFRFPVPPQADCCYFHGMAESRFLNESLFQNQPIGAPRMKALRSPARFRPYGTCATNSAIAWRAGFAIAAMGFLSACEQNTFVPPPPPKVEVAVPLQRPFTRYLESDRQHRRRSRMSIWSRACRAFCNRSITRTAPS